MENPNFIVPTAPAGDSTHRAASTEFVTIAIASAATVRQAGDVIQSVRNFTGSVASGTTVIPFDDTIPQNTEGDQYFSLPITPLSTSNLLRFSGVFNLASSDVNVMTVALFQNNITSAIAASLSEATLTGSLTNVSLNYQMISGTTSVATFTIRCGGNNVGTTTLNGLNGSRIFGGVMSSGLMIEEIKV